MLAEQVAGVFGVSGRDVRAIVHVAFAGPMSCTQLADRLQVTRGAMTGIARRLQEAGWVTVEPDPCDGRRLIMAHSARTEELLGQWFKALCGEVPSVHGRPPHPSFPHDLAAVAVVLERQRAMLAGLGPAEARRLADR